MLESQADELAKEIEELTDEAAAGIGVGKNCVVFVLGIFADQVLLKRA